VKRSTYLCARLELMASRNITFSLSADLMAQEQRSWAAAGQLLAIAWRGPCFDRGPRSETRDEIHEQQAEESTRKEFQTTPAR
jgi:hypothetical protein